MQPFLAVDSVTNQPYEMVVASPRSAAQCVTPRLHVSSKVNGFVVKNKGDKAAIVSAQKRCNKPDPLVMKVTPLPPSVNEPIEEMQSIVCKLAGATLNTVERVKMSGQHHEQVLTLKQALNARQGEIAACLSSVEYNRGLEYGLAEGRALAESIWQVKLENHKLESEAQVRELKVLQQEKENALKCEILREREKSAVMQRQICALHSQLQAVHELKPTFNVPLDNDFPCTQGEVEAAIDFLFAADNDKDSLLDTIAD